MEHAAQHGGDRMAGQLAVVTAILATLGAMFSYMGGATQAEAALAKNDAAIRKTEASDTWNFYQAKNIKLMLSELSLDIVPEARRQKIAADIERYRSEKDPIMAKARKLEEEATEFDKRSEELMHQHHRWAQATTALQISIAMAAIALLTRRRWLAGATLGIAAVGILAGVMAFLHH
jgi:hypothetical protein